MHDNRRLVIGVGVILILAGAIVSPGGAQPPGTRPATSSTGRPVVTVVEPPVAGAAGGVVVRHEPLRLLDPAALQVPLVLQPIRQVTLAPWMAGVVGTVHVRPGSRVAEQAEVLRLEPKEFQLAVDRARAQLDAAAAELQLARGAGSAAATEAAESKLRAAKAGLDLATLRLERTAVRAPFGGQIFSVDAAPGEFVLRGQPVAVLGDTSRLTVEIPVDRKKVKAGDTVELRQGARNLSGRVEIVLPLAERFAPLREVIDSAVSALVVVDNARDEWGVGQRVEYPLIPRTPTAAVPTGAMSKTADGSPRVQVLRDNVVRDVRVQPLGPNGPDRIYVSGPFEPNDALIVDLSQPVAAGTVLRPATAQPATPRQAPANGD